jgi:phage/plasmid-like protein (TIGR03299 family)
MVMAHEIDFSTGNAAVFVTGKPAWHRLGTVIESAATSAEAIRLAHLDWEVLQWPVRAFGGYVSVDCPTMQANVRNDTNAVLGVVGRQYRVFQNAEAFDFMDALVGEKLAMYETAGSLKGGRRVWMLARIPGEYRIGREDIVHPYVLLTNAHDGTQALRMLPTTVRVVCQNTLNLAIRQAVGGLSIYHTAGLDARIKEARRNLGIITRRMQQFGDEARALAARSMSASETVKYFHEIASDGRSSEKETEKIIERFFNNFDNARNMLPGIEHSAWAAYNAVSEWADHQKRGTGKTLAAKDDNRLNSIWFGTANKIKQRAFSSALQLVG